MAFESLSQFFAMGGHGLYVWLSYGVGLVVLIINWKLPGLRRRQVVREISQRIRRENAQEGRS
ncbi:heme exporter protein CcmD [Hahella sp. SMD15-11]|uniref:Heme exporter protein D n=1 Tax=Thermohahella caldifontis TaxID=3142973 RepID=A0AB39UXN4_9GAMM